MIYLLPLLLGAVLYRARGGGLHSFEKIYLGTTDAKPLRTTFRRLVYWDIPLAVIITIVTVKPWLGLACLPFIYLGHSGYWGGKFNLADPVNRNWKNYARLTVAGFSTVAPLSLFLCILKYLGCYSGMCAWAGVAAGITFVPAYLIYARFNKMGEFWNWGEIISGGIILLGILITI